MARGRRTTLVIELTAEEQRELHSWQRSTTIRAGLARRGRIILLLARKHSVSEVCRMLPIARRHVYKWAERVLRDRIDGLAAKPGRGRKAFRPAGGGGASGQDGL